MATSTCTVAVDITDEKEDSCDQQQQTDNHLPPPKRSSIQLKHRNALKILLKNWLFYGRIATLLITIFLLIVCISYAIGQVSVLELSNYWCNAKTVQEIRKNSRDNGLGRGSANDCWVTSTDKVDLNLLWSDKSYSQKMETSPSSIVKCSFFVVLSILYILLILFYVISLILDTNRIWRGKYIKPIRHKKYNPFAAAVFDSNCVLKYGKKTFLWYTKAITIDSGKWLIFLLFREVMEICLQSQALLLYNGTNPLSKNVYLAYSPQYIELFAVFLFLNSMTCSILWLCYAFQPILCHGLLFELSLSSLDAIYDTFYTLFPLIVAFNDSNSSMLVSLAALQTKSQIAFWVTFVPMTFLWMKCWTMLAKSKKGMYDMYITQKAVTINIPMTQNPQNQNGQQGKSTSTAIISTLMAMQMQPSMSWVLTTTANAICHPLAKRIYLTILSFLFATYGIGILLTVINHFNFAITHCNKGYVDKYNFADYIHSTINSSNNDDTYLKYMSFVADHPELYVWDRCYYKVYPFDNTCDCRIFRISYYFQDQDPLDLLELDKYFNFGLDEIPFHIFSKWRMLEKFEWENLNDIYQNHLLQPTPINFTKSMFIAQRMRVFVLNSVSIGYFDEAISEWSDLEYFRSTQDGLNQLPSTFADLQKLKHFEWGQRLTPQIFPKVLCSLKELLTIYIMTSNMVSIPHCISKLENLKVFILGFSGYMTDFPLAILSMAHLETFDIESNKISVQRLKTYNNITNNDELDNYFDFDYHGRFYSFAESKFCLEYNENPSLFPPKFMQFIQDTGCCDTICDYQSNQTLSGSFLASRSCTAFQWGQGFCYDPCNTKSCGWSGGDCHQLCECLIDNETNIELLGNGYCDMECNSEFCDYDGGDCTTNGNITAKCAAGYGTIHFCKPEWVKDTFCDSQCEFVSQCHNDGGACDDCEQHSDCYKMTNIFLYVALQNTADNFITEDEICPIWGVIEAQQAAFGEQIFSNCTHFMEAVDSNHDSKLNLYETMVGTRQFYDVSLEKAQQIDCSKCLSVPEHYKG